MSIKIGNHHMKFVNLLIAIYCFTSMHVIFMQVEVSPILYNIRHAIVIVTAVAVCVNELVYKTEGLLGAVTISAFALFLYQGIRNVSDNEYFTINIIITFSILICILSLREDNRIECFEMFLDIYIYILSIGLFITILRLIGVDLFFGDLHPTKNKAIYNHYIYSLFAVLCDENQSYLRFCGIFNEPGVVGTVSALILTIRRYNIKDKKNIILISSGILSMSTAFFVLTIGYFVLDFLIYRLSLKKILYVIIILMVVIFMDYYLSRYNEIYMYYVHQKITNLVLDGKSNRTSVQFDLAFSNFLRSRFWIVLLGYGGGSADIYAGLISIKKFFYEYGIAGITLFANFLLQIYFKMKNRNKNAFIFLILYIISLYQRPYVFNAFTMLIFSCGLAVICSQENNYLLKDRIRELCKVKSQV